MTRLTELACFTISKPATQAFPEVGGRRVVSILITVVLPAPLGPTRPNISPGLIDKDRPSTAVRDPKRLVSDRCFKKGSNFAFLFG